MNNYEQEAGRIIEENASCYGGEITERSQRKIASILSTLHDNEMIAFAEWVESGYFKLDNNKWVNRKTRDYTKQYTTSELLTIFRNEQNK